MLIFPLKKEWYEKIKSGEKTVEYREVKPYWEKRISSEGQLSIPMNSRGDSIKFRYSFFHKCILRLGYTKKYMTATITKIEVVNGKDTDLHIDKPVYAIHLADVKEVKIEY